MALSRQEPRPLLSVAGTGGKGLRVQERGVAAQDSAYDSVGTLRLTLATLQRKSERVRGSLADPWRIFLKLFRSFLRAFSVFHLWCSLNILRVSQQWQRGKCLWSVFLWKNHQSLSWPQWHVSVSGQDVGIKPGDLLVRCESCRNLRNGRTGWSLPKSEVTESFGLLGELRPYFCQ